MYEISFVTDPSVRPPSYILFKCVHVTESGRSNPKIFQRASRASASTPLSKFLDPPLLPWLFLTLIDSPRPYHCSTWLYYTLPWLYFALPDSTTLYHGSACLYLTLLHSTMSLLHSIPLFHVTLLDSTTFYNSSTWLYYTIPWLYLALHDSTTF